LFGASVRAEPGAVPVTVHNFVRAETDMYLAKKAKTCFGKLVHSREVSRIDSQSVVRENRDTLYSSAVFDLDAAPVTITLPDSAGRFMSMQTLSEDHYVVDVVYGPGEHKYTREQVGTRYVFVIVRTFVDPSKPEDLQQAHRLQDAIHVEHARLGTFEVPNWDSVSQNKVRDALITLGTSFKGNAFGRKGEVDPIDHLICTATGWGGNPRRDAVYETHHPAANDGKTVHVLKVGSVPVDGFWSVSVYNAKGFFEKNALDAYSLNSATAKRDAQGGVTIQFGGCNERVPNCLPVMKGWNYTVRLYRPHKQIVDDQWRFPSAEPVKPSASAATAASASK
jgi:para-nitrobenzyl esterase